MKSDNEKTCKILINISPYRFTVRQKKREVAVTSGLAHFLDKICAKVVSILHVSGNRICLCVTFYL